MNENLNTAQEVSQEGSWNDWRKGHMGHEAAMAAMTALRDYAVSYHRDLAHIRKEWQTEKAGSQQIYNGQEGQAQNQLRQEKESLCRKIQSDVEATNARKAAAVQIVNACETFLSNIPKGAKEANEQAASSMERVKGRQQEVMRALDAKTAAYRQLERCGIADAEALCSEKIDRARREQMSRDAKTDQLYQEKLNSLEEHRRKELAKGFGKEAIHAYVQAAKSSRFNGEHYECPKEIPDYVFLGELGLMIPDSGRDELPVVQEIELQTGEVGTRTEQGYLVKLPYCQRLSEGISLLMRYSGEERSSVQSMIQPLLMKLFMSFPAGKLEATMIDPLELGASFPDIPKLAEGPNSARIIDTKIWSKEKDIEAAMATLRQKLENMTQAYGGDQESRLKKEVIRALAITDFPTNFNETALKDLHAIVRNSVPLGVCVLICANETELKKLKERHETLVNEITRSVFETKAEGSRLMLLKEEYEGLFLELDEMGDVAQNKAAIMEEIRNAMEHVQLKVEHFGSMFRDDIYDSNNWFKGNHQEIAIPVGIKGADTVIKMVLGRGGGSTEHHALIAGQTGAGKSTFLHTLIMSTLISYSPEEVQMYLLDFKEGVEFGAYTRYRLPSLRVVAINSEREFGLNVLKELCVELESRTKHFTRYGVSDINSYVKLSDAPKVPKLLLIFDEVQELFRSQAESDSISAECLSCLNRLVMQGRAMGIHIILACQDFRNCAGLSAYFSQMAIRIAVKGSEEGASSILSGDNPGIHTLQNQPAGAAIYNGGGGVESANNFFQISYINEEERLELLGRLDAYYTDPVVAPLYDAQETRILLTNGEDNIHNCFNQLILKGADSIRQLGESEDGYGLLLGQGFGRKSVFMPELRPRMRDNLLVVSRDEKLALSIFELSAMSLLYEELHTEADKENALIYVIDMFAEELTDDECDFDYLEEQFPQQVRIAKMRDAEELISSLYETLMGRSEGSNPSSERIFLLFFGINRAKRLRTGSMYEEEYEDQLSPTEMLKKIMIHGPKYGINSIVWSENIKGVENMLGERYEGMFDKRIAYGLDDESMDLLVSESSAKSLRGRTAVYMDIGTDVKNTHFRPYDIPARIWVEEYAKAYETVIMGGEY